MATNLLAPKSVNALRNTGEGSYLRQRYPNFYGLLGGLLGTAPDEFEGSVMDPLTSEVRKGADIGYPAGIAAAIAPFTGGIAAARSVTQGGKAAQRGIIGYHGTTKNFKNFDARKANVERDLDPVSTMNAIGPHLAPETDTVNNFLLDAIENAPSSEYKSLNKWMAQFSEESGLVYPPKSNIRRVDVDMTKPLDVGTEDFFDAVTTAESWPEFVKYVGGNDTHRFDHIKPVIEEIIRRNKSTEMTSQAAADNIRSVMSEHGYDGIIYEGVHSDIAGKSSFIPFNIKNMTPSWGGAPTKYPLKEMKR